MDAKDLTKYAIIQIGPLTTSGYPEIIARFVFKKDATRYLNSYSFLGKRRMRGMKIVKITSLSWERYEE